MGCGVGWGPGFGPESVGFVGSGCGVGINMGVTLVGIGIGLPASGLTCVPCNVVTGAGQRVHEMGTWMAPIVFSLAMQTWKSMNTSLLRLDQQLQRGREKIVHRSRPRQQSTLSNVQSLQPTTGDIDTFNNRTQLKVTTSQNAHQVSHQDAGHNDFIEGK